jgi:hypothetical protein
MKGIDPAPHFEMVVTALGLENNELMDLSIWAHLPDGEAPALVSLSVSSQTGDMPWETIVDMPLSQARLVRDNLAAFISYLEGAGV